MRVMRRLLLTAGLAASLGANAFAQERRPIDAPPQRRDTGRHEIRKVEKNIEAEQTAPEELVENPVQNMWSWDYRGKNVEGEPLKEGEHPMPPPFSMNLLNFAILVILLAKVAWPSLKRVVRERHDDIAKALAEGARLRDEAKKKLDDYTARLAGMQGEIDRLVTSIRAEAEAEKKRIIAEAEARAARMERDAKLQIDAEIRRVTLMLEREVAVAAVAAAETLLRDKTTEADQRAFADRFVAGLQSETAARTPA